jgi:hypothetical protein
VLPEPADELVVPLELQAASVMAAAAAAISLR